MFITPQMLTRPTKVYDGIMFDRLKKLYPTGFEVTLDACLALSRSREIDWSSIARHIFQNKRLKSYMSMEKKAGKAYERAMKRPQKIYNSATAAPKAVYERSIEKAKSDLQVASQDAWDEYNKALDEATCLLRGIQAQFPMDISGNPHIVWRAHDTWSETHRKAYAELRRKTEAPDKSFNGAKRLAEYRFKNEIAEFQKSYDSADKSALDEFTKQIAEAFVIVATME